MPRKKIPVPTPPAVIAPKAGWHAARARALSNLPEGPAKQFVTMTERALLDYLGDEPTAVEAMVVQTASLLWLEVSRLSRSIAIGSASTTDSSTKLSSLSSSLLRHLKALKPRGGERRDVEWPDLQSYIDGRAEDTADAGSEARAEEGHL